jgi:glycosyltransferase involved in cell wall biosynthesis
MPPFFSIIIPTYNAAKTIEACIESVLSQHFFSFEILIIDGLSKDGTSSIVKKKSDERIKFISEADEGVYSAMNKGINISTGEYLYFLGSDDTLMDNNILQVVFETCKNKENHFVYGDVLFAKSKQIYAGEFNLEKLMHYQNISHQAIFYRKDCFAILGNYNLKYKIAADWDFNIRCFMHPNFKIKYINKTIACYNDVSGLSKENRDIEFEKNSIFFLTQKNNEETNAYKYSKEYRIGRIISSPIKSLVNYFKK